MFNQTRQNLALKPGVGSQRAHRYDVSNVLVQQSTWDKRIWVGPCHCFCLDLAILCRRTSCRFGLVFDLLYSGLDCFILFCEFKQVLFQFGIVGTVRCCWPMNMAFEGCFSGPCLRWVSFLIWLAWWSLLRKNFVLGSVEFVRYLKSWISSEGATIDQVYVPSHCLVAVCWLVCCHGHHSLASGSKI